MTKTRNATPKQRRSSRARNDNRPWGFSRSSFSRRVFAKLKRDVDRGVIPSSALTVSMKIVGRKREV